MGDESFQEKTERATPKRIKDAREKGQVARSQELSSVAIMLVAILSLMVLGPTLSGNIRGLATWVFSNATTFIIRPDTTPALMAQVGWMFVKTAAPIIGLIGVVAFGVTYLQVGTLFSTKALEPQFDRLDFIKGAKKFINPRTLFNIARDVAKLFIIGTVAYYAVKKEIPTFLTFPELEAPQIASSIFAIALKIALKVCMALVVVAVADYAWQRYDYFKGLRMSKQEVREELKHTEGNPLIKSRVRAIQRQQARQRMMQEVPEADVVVTNPTQIAVALKYDTDAMDAPTVVAKGQRLVAEAIKRAAREAGIPIVENKPLARTLFKTVEIGMQVPAHLYKAVAEVLAYVYSLKGKGK